ncbi:hypothetical protein [uncultured Microbulbifer sp.]|uniref:hypothetical protein n=1 Tax=uncultured Microbulbifer sp. TaxID=348147 RepID=UPI0026152ACD|nr:hypothetical protein [uncultured Microbulbifer sp.]
MLKYNPLAAIATNFFSIIALMLLFTGPVSAETQTCKILRTSDSRPPIRWNYQENPKYDKKNSTYNSESCNVPEGSIIKSLKIGYDFERNTEALPNGILQGWYGLEVKGTSPGLPSSIIGFSRESGVFVGFPNDLIGIGENLHVVPGFEGIDLHNLKLDISSNLRRMSNFSCSFDVIGCLGFLHATYTLSIDYELANPIIPLPPAWVVAVASGSSITVRWEDVGDVAYKIAVKYNNEDWTDYSYSPSPETSSVMSWDNQISGDRIYRIIACNNAGCSEPSMISNKITIEAEVFKLETPSTPITTVSGSHIYVDWGPVSGADRYAVSIKFNNQDWTEFTYFTSGSTPWMSWNNLGSGSYQYRVKACKNGICYDSSQSSNMVLN